MPAVNLDISAAFELITYAVNITTTGAVEGETVTADYSRAAAGATVTLTPLIDIGRKLTLQADDIAITSPVIEVQEFDKTGSFTINVIQLGARESEQVYSATPSWFEAGVTGFYAVLDEGRQVNLSSDDLDGYPDLSPSSLFDTGEFSRLPYMPDKDITITAEFFDSYVINITPIGALENESAYADVSRAPARGIVTLSAENLGEDRLVHFIADGISINDSRIYSSGETASFNMPAADVEVSATFQDTYNIDIYSFDAIGSEQVLSDTIAAAAGQTVTLTAVLGDDRGVSIASKAGAIDYSPNKIYESGGQSTFTMPAFDLSIDAFFKDAYDITVTSIGALPTESFSATAEHAVPGNTVSMTAALEPNRQVTLEAGGLTLSEYILTNTGEESDFTMPTCDVEVTATFVDTYPIIITLSGVQSTETVTSNVSFAPEGETITLTVEDIHKGQQVTFSADGIIFTPEMLNYSATSTFIMPAAPVDVSAVFED